MNKGLSVIVKGKVQGVFFRASTVEQAERFGVSGWVKNTSDGHVEMEIYGDPIDLDKMLDWCKTGPSRAEVAEVNTKDIDYLEGYKSFQVRYN